MDMITVIGFALYAVSCIIWAYFSVEMNKRFADIAPSIFRNYLVFAVNALFCPICMLIACGIVSTNSSWAKNIKKD